MHGVLVLLFWNIDMVKKVGSSIKMRVWCSLLRYEDRVEFRFAKLAFVDSLMFYQKS